ncbi:Lysophospholipase L1 [Bradyrhizobium sp. Rc3b]|uniref:GDSL-type esterase/lipase family protein n=1 Tax=Bradyrhizobium sp. Rc3b TaxID=1855322 RepID=UPI0008F1C9C2|nr:GDSL-type esterase/lipase family protein [Bradyrhizobium sp. Rc3b]SFM49563.1 Lysophospholipase L1 [Bradyrhizobium sp. Rc3b]
MRRFIPILASLLIVVQFSSGEALARSKRILVFGDSNTWGSTARVAGRQVTRLPDDQRWAGVLASSLSESAVVLVDGLSGRTVDVDRKQGIGAVTVGSDFNGAKALRAAIAREMPLDLVVLMLGTNDLAPAFDKTPTAIAQSAMGLASIVRSSEGGTATSYPAPQVLVVVPPLLGNLTSPPMNELFAGAPAKAALLSNAFLEASRIDRVPVFDASTVVKTEGDDGVHLTVDNHRTLGKALAPVVDTMLRDVR